MRTYRCQICGHLYDPDEGEPGSDIPPGTEFDEVLETWACPACGASKNEFEPYFTGEPT